MTHINLEILQKYADAFILYELKTHNVNPRKTLDGTIMRVKKEEGYKAIVYDKYKDQLSKTDSYCNTVIAALPGGNLVHRRQKEKVVDSLKENGMDAFEHALTLLYEGTNDEFAFNKIVEIVGGYFDVLGFLFFLKDRDKYLPIRSSLFDERMSLLGVQSELAGNCTWDKYNQYLSWVDEVRDYLASEINEEITLLDAHSFVWFLPKLDSFLIEPLSNKGVEVAGALLQLISEMQFRVTYGELSEMAESKPNPHFELPILLDAINRRCRKLNLPCISAMVVNKDTRLPGGGFRELCIEEFGYASDFTTEEMFEKELQEIRGCTAWEKLAASLDIKMPDPIHPRSYLVVQGRLDDDEHRFGYLWAPCEENNERSYTHWKLLTQLQPDDVIYHYKKGGLIVAVSRITNTYKDVKKPGALDNRIGHLVKCYTEILDVPLKIKDHLDIILKYKQNNNHSAFNRNGVVNRGYLFKLEPEIAVAFDNSSKGIGREVVAPYGLKEEEEQALAQIIDLDSLEQLARRRSEASKTAKRAKEQKTTIYQRDQYISEFVKRKANGKCQLCGRKAPFCNKKGQPYLESHHVIWLSEGGKDTIDNVVALCPNCHRKMHVLNDPEDVKALLKR